MRTTELSHAAFACASAHAPQAMFAAIDADESGTVDWSELVNFLCDTLEHVERETYVARMEGQGQEAAAAE
jgi:hypothetical protein